MAPLRRVTRPMFRYGEADFDYLRWGMHDRATQIREAESALAILQPAAPLFSEEVAGIIYRALRPGGAFVSDTRNPANPQVKARNGSWRNWREENGVFYLERHEANAETGQHEDAWITIDPAGDVIEEKVSVADPVEKSTHRIPILQQAGFGRVQLKTMEGEDFTGGEEPRWLWLVAHKG